MTVGRWMAAIGCVLALAGSSPAPSHATTTVLGEELRSAEAIFHCSALIAQVRVAGEVPSRRAIKRREGDNEALWLVEIMDAAQGPATGELVLVETRGARKAAEHFRAGATFLLLATREINGVYRPLPDDGGVWPIDKAGKLTTHRYGKLLPPAVDATKPSDVIAWFWNEAQQHAYSVSIALNQDDLTHFDASHPLRLAITIDNTGGRPLSINNAIEFEYDMHGDELIEEKKHLASLPEVKVYARPLRREHVLSDIARMLRQESELTLSPGERCAAEFDLSQEPQIYGGMRYQLWVEVGGRTSRSIVFETPGDGEELALEELAEFEGDGPFRKVRSDDTPRHTMPDVQTTDQTQAVQAALRAWMTERPRLGGDDAQLKSEGCEIVLLGRAHLSPEFTGVVDGIRYILVDRYLERTDRPSEFTLRDAKATFRSRVLRVEQIEIAQQTARIVIRDVVEEESGMLAIMRLVRERGQWRSDGEIELAIH